MKPQSLPKTTTTMNGQLIEKKVAHFSKRVKKETLFSPLRKTPVIHFCTTDKGIGGKEEKYKKKGESCSKCRLSSQD